MQPHIQTNVLSCLASCTAPLAPAQVHHFFKAGMLHSSGKAMVLCLAQQLAEKLKGFAALLASVVQEHKGAQELSLEATFEE